MKTGRRRDSRMKFKKEASHLQSLLTERDRTNNGRIPFGISFLDDCLGGIFPRDLLLLGAPSGVGKTALAVSIARRAAALDKQVYLFALEAEVGEVSSRLYFERLGQLAGEPMLDYGGWWRGEWEHLDREYGDQVKAELEGVLANVHTLYKDRGDFTPADLAEQLDKVRECADVVILDHIHVVDSELGSENATQQRAIRVLRDLALASDIPVVAVSHVRKSTRYQSGLVPALEDLHGSSSLYKVCTGAVLFARDWDHEPPSPELSPTYLWIPKDRRGRSSRSIARINYNVAEGRYEKSYELGRSELDGRKETWKRIDYEKLPYWAKSEARRKMAALEALGI